jgi:glutaredoxin-related protein
MTIKLYGSQHWPGCPGVKEALLQKGIEFDYIEITDSMKNLKEFLKLRDTKDDFNITRRVHAVGIPMLLINKQVHLNITDELINSL